jgi:general secretion pathway protein H
MRPAARTRWAVQRSRAARRPRGFTLIEILVVVVIIGMISVGMLLSVNLAGRDRDLENESQRIQALINYAREQAELQTREYGLLALSDGYQFVAFDVRKNLWQSVDGDDTLRTRSLPTGLTLSLVVEGRPAVLKKPDKGDPSSVAPQVMIFSNGDLTSFELTVQRDSANRSVTIQEDNTGKVVVKPMVEGRSK